MAFRLLVGLGNPGLKYVKTRHNAGAWLLSELAVKQGLNFREESKFFGRVTLLTAGAEPCWLLIPSTFMNESGRSVHALAHFYKIPPEQILVAHDDLDLPPGVVRLKAGGGHGGHNGLRDIIQCLGSPQFYRIRIGVGHPGNRDQVTPYVLSEPSVHEKNKITQAIEASFAIFPDLLNGEIDRAFRYLHTDQEG